MESQKSEHKPWNLDSPVSRGAAAYHEAVSNAGYYMEALDELTKVVTPKIRQNDIVIDFGAGTGVSALRLLEHLKVEVELWLVDNSAAWLGKAYETFSNNTKVKCFLLEKKNDHYETLENTVGKKSANHVISAHTVHLIPDLNETFKGIAESLKQNGTFTFLSGNIPRSDGPKGALLVDDTVKRVHDLALEIVRKDSRFSTYRNELDNRIKLTEPQRKFVFPDPRPIEVYLQALRQANFKYVEHHYRLIRVKYDDWLNFLRVKRLQAGILPEIGGNEPSPKEESDRDTLITLAANKLFSELRNKNPLADIESFVIDFLCVAAIKQDYYMLYGKNAMVTGASRGIGKAIAIELAKNGVNIIINYKSNEKKALEVVDEVKKYANCIMLKADVGNFDEVKSMFDAVKKEFGNLDILVNNAGIIMDKTLQNMSQEEWSDVIKVNLNGIFNVTKKAVPIMNKSGRIINISSIVALDGNFGQTNYAASKAGITGFTKSLAKELGKYDITVNSIEPGLIETDIIRDIPSKRRKELDRVIPIGRIGTPKDIANVAIFLASNRASYITGEVIRVDGGLIF